MLPGIDPNLRLAVEGERTESLLEWAVAQPLSQRPVIVDLHRGHQKKCQQGHFATQDFACRPIISIRLPIAILKSTRCRPQSACIGPGPPRSPMMSSVRGSAGSPWVVTSRYVARSHSTCTRLSIAQEHSPTASRSDVQERPRVSASLFPQSSGHPRKDTRSKLHCHRQELLDSCRQRSCSVP